MSDAYATSRDAYPHFLKIPTRWMDNDVYRHVNNVVYYSYYDTLIGEYLIREGGLDVENSEVVGFCVESFCQYHKPISFPQVVEGGLRVTKIGRSSVRYEIGLFIEGDPEPASVGHFVHVFVKRPDNEPAPVPEPIRAALEKIQGE